MSCFRLTVPYMIMYGFNAALADYLGSGPMWPLTFDPNGACHKYWWTNLLYINNFFSDSTQVCFFRL